VGNGAQATVDGVTVIRTRGLIELTISAATAGLDGYAGAFGIAICSNDAFAVGVTAVPTPISDVAWDGWMWHQFFSVHAPAAFQATGTGPYATTIEIDCKAMRKINVGETLYMAVEATEIGACVLTVRADTRILSKLH